MTPRRSATVTVHFHAAHYLPEHPGKCGALHGHTYNLEVCVQRIRLGKDTDANDMVVDFGDLKGAINHTIVDAYDHAYIAFDGDPMADLLIPHGHKIVSINVGSNPTAESMLLDMYNRLNPKAKEMSLSVRRMRLWETDSSSVEINMSE